MRALLLAVIFLVPSVALGQMFQPRVLGPSRYSYRSYYPTYRAPVYRTPRYNYPVYRTPAPRTTYDYGRGYRDMQRSWMADDVREINDSLRALRWGF